MTRDFTCEVYERLLRSFMRAGYAFLTLEQYFTEGQIPAPWVILRHDVDRRPDNALTLAKIEHSLGIPASYYFRIVEESFSKPIIAQIASMGHEIGYHYEDLDLAKGDRDKAYELYTNHLARINEFYPVRTVCMHGSPLSRWDNRDLWTTHSYKLDGVVGEPYFDIDYHEVCYLTDTGRTWKQGEFVIRDRVNSSFPNVYRSTHDIVEAADRGELPSKLLVNTHPHRWDDLFVPWASQLVGQNLKNVAKYALSKTRNVG